MTHRLSKIHYLEDSLLDIQQSSISMHGKEKYVSANHKQLHIIWQGVSVKGSFVDMHLRRGKGFECNDMHYYVVDET